MICCEKTYLYFAGIWTLTSSQPFSTPTDSRKKYSEKSRARFIALPVAKSRGKVFDFLKNCGAVAAGVVLPELLRTAIFVFVFPDIVLIKSFAAMS
ncbi:hypothetical protein F2Q69_00043356 [Brassica cretica]|uniref:Uncharacterized protein n=1 Tax=Brassica cretica TaxID=69181 RepID=A0A8S9N9I6_BRACR|nr:hypothetical protein F2Q69_00043356 [Brassica cretica]